MTLIQFTRPQVLWQRSPLEAVNRFHEEVARLLQSPFEGSRLDSGHPWVPPVDLYEDKENLIVKLEAPGMKREAFEIGLQDGVLSISGVRSFGEGESNEPGKGSGKGTERSERRFKRSVSLPKAVQGEKVHASYKDGILTVTLPIAEEARPRQIVVGVEQPV